MRISLLAAFVPSLFAQALPGTQPLALEGDPAAQMVSGILRYLERASAASVAHRSPSADRLKTILGVNDPRVPFSAPSLVATTAASALLLDAGSYRVYAAQWPALDGMTAEGLWFHPTGAVKARVIAIPDADQLPEQMRVSQVLAASGCDVLSPTLISRDDKFSGNPRIRMTNQPHREFIYRMAFEMGRHVWGYETQKVLAAVDWFSQQEPRLPIGVWGYGEGGAVALFAAALDNRFAATTVSGYFGPREGLAKQPLFRNVFGLLKDFGDAELAGMAAPRTLLIDKSPGPSWNGPSASDPKRRGAGPGTIRPFSKAEIESEFARARQLYRGAGLRFEADATEPFLRALGTAKQATPEAQIPVRDAEARQHRQFQEMVEYTQKLIPQSERARNALWAPAEKMDVAAWEQTAPQYRSRLWDDVIGRMPKSGVALNTRTRKSYAGAKWDGFEVVYDIAPDVFGYGVLLLPKDIQPGERRPVVVAQHGLDGIPQHLFGLPETDREKGAYTNFHLYQNIGSRLADLGYIVYMPQNPYTGDFRPINRLANPLGLSLFSFILEQHDRLLDWLSSLPYVDPKRIGFYGLSYGGKTALRVPPLLDRYAISICSGDFNEWVYKVTTIDAPYSYMFTFEWEMPEFNLAYVANHAEMAKMMAPRPFMVERGHRDGVGVDEYVAYEYAKVKRFYDELGIGDRTAIEYFNGPHMIHGQGTVNFLRKYLNR